MPSYTCRRCRTAYRSIAVPLGIVGAIKVEASPWLKEDNQWVLDLIEKDPILVGCVGNIEPGKPDFAKNLERLESPVPGYSLRPFMGSEPEQRRRQSPGVERPQAVGGRRFGLGHREPDAGTHPHDHSPDRPYSQPSRGCGSPAATGSAH